MVGRDFHAKIIEAVDMAPSGRSVTVRGCVMTERQLAVIERSIIGLATVFAVVCHRWPMAQQLPRVQLTPDQIKLIEHDVRATFEK